MPKRWVYESSHVAPERSNSLCFDNYVAGDVYYVPANDWHNGLYDDSNIDMEVCKTISHNNHHRRR